MSWNKKENLRIFQAFKTSYLSERERPKFNNCRIINCQRIKLHAQHAILINFKIKRSMNFPDSMGTPATKNEVL